MSSIVQYSPFRELEPGITRIIEITKNVIVYVVRS